MNLQKETSGYLKEYQTLLEENRISEAIFLAEQKTLMFLNILGVAYSSVLLDQEKAKKCFETALKIDPSNSNACSNLSHIHNVTGNLESGLEYANRAVVYSNGSSYEGFYNQGVILLAMQRTAEAIEMFEKALLIEPNNCNAHYNLGLSLLKNQICQRGWDEYDWRFESNKTCKIFKSRCKNFWNGEDLKGKVLFIFNEQGYGDFIFFLRFIPEVKKLGCKIICEVQKPLVPLVKNFLDEGEIFERNDIGVLPQMPYSDYQTSICSLPKMLKIDDESKIPNYQNVEMNNYEKPDIFSKDKTNVGICWFGNSNHIKDHHRSTYLLNFKPILDIPDIEFFGLGKNVDKIRNWPCGKVNLDKDIDKLNITNLESHTKNFGDLGNFIFHLDAVITVDTAVAHLAGMLGKKTFLVLGKESDFRWHENTGDTVWYPSVKIFRFDETWEKTIANVKESFLHFLHHEFGWTNRAV